MSECSKCHEEKELVRGRWCRECKNKYETERRKKQSQEKKDKRKNQEKLRYEKNKAKAEELLSQINLDDEKVCTVCKESKQISEFYQAKTKGTYRAMCKKCSTADRQKYYNNNKEKVNKQTSNYKKEKMKTDPLFKLERNMRTRTYQIFVAETEGKAERSWKHIGCSPKFFQDWIKYQLYDGMTRENYGKYWNLEHVKPISTFDLSDPVQINKCFSWKNVQPYKTDKNREKGTKVLLNNIVLQELKVKVFLKKRN